MTAPDSTPTEREAGDVGEVAAVLDWRFFKAHAPIGAYLPTGQMGGNCRECRTAWPCAPYLAALAPLIAERERAAGARALREAARDYGPFGSATDELVFEWLRERADELGQS